MSILLPQRRISNVEELNDKEEVEDKNVHIYIQLFYFYINSKNKFEIS